ncbi:hypothetical protein GCM10009539_38200 [Cryptosporangium japonicum]|uniref:Secreted protein n=1 Tax=Cryptosporangium japonicum TaxID=80872 RepID=A0ABN0UG02_9ACTN
MSSSLLGVVSVVPIASRLFGVGSIGGVTAGTFASEHSLVLGPVERSNPPTSGWSGNQRVFGPTGAVWVLGVDIGAGVSGVHQDRRPVRLPDPAVVPLGGREVGT